ncbi:peptidoglycan D,D-transpeptidase FtsI family protein [Rhizobium halophytocola]|uniref:Cell division protein FtsI (Penicillin-binding protein 3) n=1 Tax=Rhizobium halophytocola TaxID=735519 RepID=A0ABS4E317_9HYPH|nr:penicillin-binding protein 2 [Rhizobium halophytocola]MBP1852341.1 cell division protein FtsI (penicillin-binding protein 3) [Rhizobium halophytocola]
MSFLSRLMLLKSQAHFSSNGQKGDIASNGASFKGSRKRKGELARKRVGLIIFGSLLVYGVIGGRLVQYGYTQSDTTSSIPPTDRLMASRPDILDRNGDVLATDIRTVSLFAEPNKVVDPDEAVEKLHSVLSDLDIKSTYRKLANPQSRFQWLKRQLTPKQQSEILALGIPGIGFRPEKRRFYPGGPTASHIVGYVNIDNHGMAGMEKYVDQQGLAALAAAGMTSNAPLEPVKLSIDLRVQNIVHDVVQNAMVNYKAKGTGAVVLDIKTGEVLAMASYPDFDPNDPASGSEDGWLNRMANGTFEMGSTFKSFTIAMGLDSGRVKLTDSFDATRAIRLGGFTIQDFHGRHAWLTVPEIFKYSSNIGTAKIADTQTIPEHKAFLTKLGLLTKMDTELPEIKMPSQPREWKKINQITISFGHGVATTPLQTAVAGAALVNGGYLIEPTFLPRTQEQANAVAERVISEKTSKEMRYLFDYNGKEGSGRNARVPGFDVGGKTGTADKVVNGRYDSKLNFNAFLAAFPISDPQYVVLTFCDEPHDGENGGTIASYTAAPMVRDIIRRSAAILGVEPDFGDLGSNLLVSY